MINGRGYLYPEGHPSHLVRPFLIRLVGCRQVHIEGIQLVQAAAWCLHLQDCEEVTVRRVRDFLPLQRQ